MAHKKKDPFAEREAQKYDSPIFSREYILEHLTERGRPATQQQLEEELHLETVEQQEALRRRLIAMIRDGQLLKNRKGAFGPVKEMALVPGRVHGHKDGFGFVIPDDGGEDLFLNPKEMRKVFHGDRVLVRVMQSAGSGRKEGVIVEILEQNTQQIVGRFHHESGVAYVEPSHQRMTQDILIPPDATHNAKEGDIVVVAVTSQPTIRTRPLGEVIEVLGDHMAPGMEINVAIRSHELPYLWPEEALLEATKFAPTVPETSIKGRTDFRDLPFVTIDGEDAKDFDDAIYCAPRAKGGFTLYVAIADVSHYVQPDSPLDKEAFKRGNSVYFPGRVLPMLPETLSNHLCSLNPNADRLVLVCEMTIQPTGRISQFRFHEAVIHSKARLTYKEVYDAMEKKDRRVRERLSAVIEPLETLYELFYILQAARTVRGAIDFDMPETKIIFGRDRKIEKIIPYERYNSHRVIEECMLCANICAAKFLEKNSQPTLYRVHEGPSKEKWENLRKFLVEMGLAVPVRRDPVSADYAHLLSVTKDRPDQHMIQTVFLRSMSQAIYSPQNKGHFGLAYKAYAHFTSPIRRYPDLLVHRGIRALLKEKHLPSDIKWVGLGEHCSMTERRADDATHDAKDWLKCEFMLDKVGEEFQGTISGITGFGIFVELKDVYVEGLIHISTLPNDYYRFDSVKHMLIGERTGKKFRLGDPIQIKVVRVDLDQRQIDFMLAGISEKAAEKKPKQKKPFKQKKQKRGK